MSRQKKSSILNPQKKSKRLISFLTDRSFLDIKAKIHSNSMSPLLESGMEVIINSKNPRLGDIACYYSRSKQRIIAHRVIKVDVDNNKFILKGDNRGDSEEISITDVVGRIKAIVTRKKHILMLDTLPLQVVNYLLFLHSRISYDYPFLRYFIRGRKYLVKLTYLFY